jgi:hypothetical protein
MSQLHSLYQTVNYMWNFKPNESKGIPMECIQQNKRFIPEHTIVTPADIIPLLSSFPGLPELWEKIPDTHWVIKADLGRLLYIYKHGGIYLDVDCVINDNPLQYVNPKSDRMILFTEFTVPLHALGPRECKNPQNALRVANFAFATNYKRHPFLELCIRECIRRLDYLMKLNIQRWEQTDILWVCGPDVVTTMYHEHQNDDSSIRLMGQKYIYHHAYGTWRN